MIFTALIVVTALAAAEGATTVTMPPMTTTMATTTQMPPTILYDMQHHKAMIVVVGDGCYEYHMNHQDVVDAGSDATRPNLEGRMLMELSQMTSKTETGHNHINHMTQEIRTACAALPVYSFTI